MRDPHHKPPADVMLAATAAAAAAAPAADPVSMSVIACMDVCQFHQLNAVQRLTVALTMIQLLRDTAPCPRAVDTINKIVISQANS